MIKATNSSCVVFGGGEPTLLKEFENLINFFSNEGFKNIRVNSSGIRYSNSLENALKEGIASLVISPDSGTRDLYKTIKRVDMFDVVWKNISKYSLNSKFDDSVKAKYILINSVNDNKSHIDNFFKQCIKYNVRSVSLSVEQHWYDREFPEMSERVYDLISYFEQKAIELKLSIELYCEAISILKNRKLTN